MNYLISFIIAFLFALCVYWHDNYKLALKHINKLHFENENYLKALLVAELIPQSLVDIKINQMNDLYGKVELITKNKE